MSSEFKPQTVAELYQARPCQCGETSFQGLDGATRYTLSGKHTPAMCTFRTRKHEAKAAAHPVDRCDNGACWCWAPDAQ